MMANLSMAASLKYMDYDYKLVMGDGGHNVPVIQDAWGIRKLTPAECLSLQGFPAETFSFPAGLSKVQQYKQIGNAVTVPLVMKLAAECRRLLDERCS